MADVEKIKNLARIAARLRKMQNEMRKKAAKSVIVGYTAAYALSVHENVEMKWKGLPRGAGFSRKDGVVRFSSKILKTGSVGNTGKGFYWDPQGKAQAKFLEAPARTLRPELARIINQVYAKTKDMQKALIAAGLRLIRESIQLVPVDTGNLKNSWFVRTEDKLGGSKPVAKGSSSKG